MTGDPLHVALEHVAEACFIREVDDGQWVDSWVSPPEICSKGRVHHSPSISSDMTVARVDLTRCGWPDSCQAQPITHPTLLAIYALGGHSALPHSFAGGWNKQHQTLWQHNLDTLWHWMSGYRDSCIASMQANAPRSPKRLPHGIGTIRAYNTLGQLVPLDIGLNAERNYIHRWLSDRRRMGLTP